MVEHRKSRHDYGFTPEQFDTSILPDVDHEFLSQEDLDAFAQALHGPDTAPLSPGPHDNLKSRSSLELTHRASQLGLKDDAAAVTEEAAAAAADVQAPGPPGVAPGLFITAQNDWAPVNEKVYKKKGGRGRRSRRVGTGQRTKDETREGFFYALLRWPMLLVAAAWLAGLGATYLITRFYIWIYEHFFTWRGQREMLRRRMRLTSNYDDWVAAARELDTFLGRQRWKEENEFAYYDSKTVRRVWDQMRKCRRRAEAEEPSDESGVSASMDVNEHEAGNGGKSKRKHTAKKTAVEDLRALIEACVKNNFCGVENPRLYSQTYYGTKNLVQNFVDEGTCAAC
jgi:hypothetical protein